jgi:MFS family permease
MTTHLEDLKEIRTMMEKSSRFISLSGLSGVFAGSFAIIGAYIAYKYSQNTTDLHDLISFYFINAIIVLILALASGVIFTYTKAKRKQQSLVDKTAIYLLINLAIPLITGGIFCIAMLIHGFVGFIAPAMLIFYGLSLINASRYSLYTIRNLGLIQLTLGLFNLFYIGYGFYFWVLGFGIMHIIYGTYMYYKYDRD